MAEYPAILRHTSWASKHLTSSPSPFSLLAIFSLHSSASSCSYYVVHQPYKAFGKYDGDMTVTSAGLFVIAAFMDMKEIYYCVKKVRYGDVEM